MRFSKRRPDLKFFTCRPAKISNTSGVLELRKESRSCCPFWSTCRDPYRDTPGRIWSPGLYLPAIWDSVLCWSTCLFVFLLIRPRTSGGRDLSFYISKHQGLMNHVVRELIPFFMEDKWVHSGSATRWLRYKTGVIGGSVHQGQHLGAQAQHQTMEDKRTVDIHK